MLVISHRGARAEYAENTLEAFRAAIALGVDGIETDVRLSADGFPVLCHDRVAPDGREVALLTRAELAEALGHPVPTLDEALDLKGVGLWNIEIKTPAAKEAALAVLNEYATSRDILVTSFWHDLVASIARGGRFRCGALLASRLPNYQAMVALLDNVSSVTSIIWDYEIFDPSLVGLLADRNIKNMVYGVTSEREHDQCRRWGLDGVITDYPGYLLSKKGASHGLA